MRLTPRSGLLGLVTLGVFGFLNLRNWCQPGWCGRFGFPLTYRTWSDQLVDLNGRLIGGPTFSQAALAVDILVALAAVACVAGLARLFPVRNQQAA
jgi:hypothetical protein